MARLSWRISFLLTVVVLIALLKADSELILVALCSSLERVIEDAYYSVCSDRINVFDQARINSFLQRPSAADRPLIVKLKELTWRKYVSIWGALLCFAYRTTQHECRIQLRH